VIGDRCGMRDARCGLGEALEGGHCKMQWLADSGAKAKGRRSFGRKKRRSIRPNLAESDPIKPNPTQSNRIRPNQTESDL
jgi:hypothetical protein